MLFREAGLLRVRWDDGGQEEEVKIGGRITLADRGSLRYQWLIDPDSLAVSLRARFAAEPLEVILQLLRESRKAMKAQDIKGQLIAYGIGKESLDDAWTSVYRKLSKLDEVEAKSSTYRWVGPVSEPAIIIDGRPPAETADEPDDEVSVRVLSSEDVPAEDTKAPIEPSAEMPEAPTEPSGEVVEAFDQARVEIPPETFYDHAETPLRAGVHFGRLDDSLIDALLVSLPDEDRVLMTALLLALPRRADVIDAPGHLAALEPAVIDILLFSAVAEVRRHDRLTSDIRSAATWFVRRVSGFERLDPSAVAPLAELTMRIAEEPEKADAEVLDVAAHTLSRLLPRMSSDLSETVEADVLARAVAHLPLTPGGGRTAVMAAAGKVWPQAMTNESWWHGATVQNLAECAAGPLGGVTSRSEVAERIIRPLVTGELAAVTTRTRLSFLLGLPHEFAAQLSAEAVATAFRRVALQDPVVAAWGRSLAGEDREERFAHELEAARSDTATAVKRAEEAEWRAQDLAERCDRLEETLRHEHAQAVGLRASQERQLQIDVVRTLADLAAEVEELAAGQTEPAVLVDRVRGLVAGQALEPIENAGAESVFDPTVHDLIVGDAEMGAAVTVIRPGYRWQSSGEDIVLHKALVSAVQPSV